MADLTLNLRLNQTVQTKDGKKGVVRYIGNLHFVDGDWLGLELPTAAGKNDGSVKGERYFQCQPGYGVFVNRQTVVKVLEQPAAATAQRVNGASTPQNGNAVRPRPASIAPADAKKRQSMMSAASRGSVAGSRLSMIVS
jgi:dynactin 1